MSKCPQFSPAKRSLKMCRHLLRTTKDPFIHYFLRITKPVLMEKIAKGK